MRDFDQGSLHEVELEAGHVSKELIIVLAQVHNLLSSPWSTYREWLKTLCKRTWPEDDADAPSTSAITASVKRIEGNARQIRGRRSAAAHVELDAFLAEEFVMPGSKQVPVARESHSSSTSSVSSAFEIETSQHLAERLVEKEKAFEKEEKAQENLERRLHASYLRKRNVMKKNFAARRKVQLHFLVTMMRSTKQQRTFRHVWMLLSNWYLK